MTPSGSLSEAASAFGIKLFEPIGHQGSNHRQVNEKDWDANERKYHGQGFSSWKALNSSSSLSSPGIIFSLTFVRVGGTFEDSKWYGRGRWSIFLWRFQSQVWAVLLKIPNDMEGEGGPFFFEDFTNKYGRYFWRFQMIWEGKVVHSSFSLKIPLTSMGGTFED